MSIYICVLVCIYIYIRISMYVYLSIYIYIYIHMTYKYQYVYIYIRVYIYICIYIYIMYICIFNVSYLRFISLINEFLDSRCQRAQGAARGWRLRMCLENTRIDASNIFASSTLIILIPENDAARSYQISGCLSQFEYVDGQAAPSSEAGHSLSGASGRRDVQERCAERKTS